jgi:hypothetical protein
MGSEVQGSTFRFFVSEPQNIEFRIMNVEGRYSIDFKKEGAQRLIPSTFDIQYSTFDILFSISPEP